MNSKDGKQVDLEVLIATASNDWKQDPIPPMPRKEGERRVLWPPGHTESEEYSLGPGFLW